MLYLCASLSKENSFFLLLLRRLFRSLFGFNVVGSNYAIGHVCVCVCVRVVNVVVSFRSLHWYLWAKRANIALLI